jgi:hypothetical protein
VTPGDVLPFITGAGGAIATLVFGITLLILGTLVPRTLHDEIVRQKDQQIANLLAANARERDRAEAAVAAAQTTRDLLAALHREVAR